MGEGIEIYGVSKPYTRAKVSERMRRFTDLTFGDVAHDETGKPIAKFNVINGGFYVAQRGHNYRKEEIEAADVLASKGFAVILQPESEKGWWHISAHFP